MIRIVGKPFISLSNLITIRFRWKKTLKSMLLYAPIGMVVSKTNHVCKPINPTRREFASHFCKTICGANLTHSVSHKENGNGKQTNSLPKKTKEQLVGFGKPDSKRLQALLLQSPDICKKLVFERTGRATCESKLFGSF